MRALEQLMGAYFHQDWWEDRGGEAWVIAAFLRESRRLAQNLPDEIAETLAAFPTDTQLEAHLDGLGCEYTPRPDEGGYSAWLADVGGRVAAGVTG